MLDFDALNKQFAGFGRYQVQERQRKAVILEKALEVYRSRLSDSGETGAYSLEGVSESRADQLVAVPLEAPTSVFDAIARPTPLTVVATDGSQIYPDRNIEPLCYLLNIGRIAFQYGTTERPLMDAVPHLYFRGQGLESVAGVEIDIVGQDIVSAFRDELELADLYELAESVRQEGRPILAFSDGTLIRWVLKRLRRPELEDALLNRYLTAMEAFRLKQIPLCSYISMPGTSEFVNYLAQFFETEEKDGNPLAGITDRMLFSEILSVGQRTGVFASKSHILKEYPAAHRICYFYVHVPGAASSEIAPSEIARVEFPFWVVEQPDMLDLIHATVLSECEKGRGYPVILSEAHEHAIVRGPERFMFYEMIEREMQREGSRMVVSGKATAKASAGM